MKASLIKTLALTSGFACLTAFTVGPAMAGDKDMAQTGKTRAEVRAEYLQAVREGTLPNTTEMDETSYRALTARGHAIKDGNALAKASESGTSPLTGKTRAEVRAEYLQAVREGTLPNTTEMDETSYRTVTARGHSMADGIAIAQAGKTRAEVRAEYLQAVKEGTLPNTTEMDETSYRTLTARGHAIKGGNALAKASESGTSPLTREAVRADTVEWMRLHRGDVQMGGQ